MVCKKLRKEPRKLVRVVEGSQSCAKRSALLAMHSARLGQLSRELEQRWLEVF